MGKFVDMTNKLSKSVVLQEDRANKSKLMWEPSLYYCNGCFMHIENQRWHCEECADFDMCGPCHDGANVDRLPKSHKPDHPMQLYIGHDA